MEYLKNKTGNIGIVQLITWGLGLVTFAGSITYASYASNSGQISIIREKQAGQEATVIGIDTRLTRIEDKIDLLINKK